MSAAVPETATPSIADRVRPAPRQPRVPPRVRQAVLRGLTHTVYHIGQILYVARLLQPDGKWLTIPPGQSRTHRASYLGGS